MNRPPFPSDRLTRREALKTTLLFSSAMFSGCVSSRAELAPPRTDFADPGLHLLAVGDFGNARNENQARVAAQMADFAKRLNRPLDAVLALGDNFYGKMTPDRFERHFEAMYEAESLPCPFHVCLGNHDYETASYGRNPEPRKSDVQLEYARTHPQSRWKLPAKWYSLELPNPQNPLLKAIVLDSNIREGDLTPLEKLEQQRFLKAELAKGTRAPWLWLVMHHPPFTATTKRQDNARLQGLLRDALQNHPVSVCIGGHDHNMQHLQVEGYRTHFIISGAGGASSYEVSPTERGFAQEVYGFNHFHLTKDRLYAQFVDADGHCLHHFEQERISRA
jgi:tartrate-resistant acid phosphatase type 5